MEYEWDEAKRVSNLAKHGIDFAAVARFDWDTADIWEDLRMPYGERRWRALGWIGERLHAVIYTKRFERTRIISLRKANDKEMAVYEKAS